jgi:hypothetical protein
VDTSPTKNPRRVEAGRISARRRWGAQPRSVRLDELTMEQRAVIVALVEAAKKAQAATKGGSS